MSKKAEVKTWLEAVRLFEDKDYEEVELDK